MYKYPLHSAPSMSIVGFKVDFPPLAATPPHTHRGASVAAYVLSGTLLNKMNDEPMEIKKAGDSFYEAPGCRHRISANHSATEEASLVANLVIDTATLDKIWEEEGPGGLVLVDEEWRKVIEDYEKNKKK